MADCAPLLDEELSSFVFSYLTENSGSQVRSQPGRILGTWGFAQRGASLHVAGSAARWVLLMRASLWAAQMHLPGSVRTGFSVYMHAWACVCVCACRHLQWLDVWLSRVLEEMSSAIGNKGIWCLKTDKCFGVNAESRKQPVCCCLAGIIWYAKGRFGNFRRIFEGSLISVPGTRNTWCASPCVDGAVDYYDILAWLASGRFIFFKLV